MGGAALAVAMASTPAQAADPAFNARAGRIVSYTGWGLMGGGGVMSGVGGLLTIYDYDGPWYDKWKYDDAFLRREPVGRALAPIGAITAGTSVPFLVAGSMIEASALKKFTRITTVPGWVGVSSILTGATLFTIGAAGAWPLLPIGGIVAGVGLLCNIAQFGINVHVAKRLPRRVHDDIYLPRRKRPLVFGAPMLLEGGGGATLLAVW